jgi:hypothetical protein
MKTENGVLEWWSEGVAERLCSPGPEAGAPTEIREVGAGGKRWVGRWVQPGEGGQDVGKRTGFSQFETVLTRLFPHNLTQVVDFPRMYVVRVFLGSVNFGFQSQAELGTDVGKLKENGKDAEGRRVRVWVAGMVATETERSLISGFVRLYANIFAYFEKKCFFPALWPAYAGTQRVGGVMTVEGCWLRVVGGNENDAKLSEKYIGFYRDASRFIGYFRTQEARNSAFSRFLSIRAFFSDEHTKNLFYKKAGKTKVPLSRGLNRRGAKGVVDSLTGRCCNCMFRNLN